MTLRTYALHGRTRADRLRNLSDTVHGFQQRGQFAGRRWAVDIDQVNDSGRFPGFGVEAAGSGHAHAVNDDVKSLGLSEDVVQHAPGDRQMQQMSPGEGRLYGDSFSRPPMWKPDDVSRHAPQRSSPRNSIKLVHTDDGATSQKTRPALTAGAARLVWPCGHAHLRSQERVQRRRLLRWRTAATVPGRGVAPTVRPCRVRRPGRRRAAPQRRPTAPG